MITTSSARSSSVIPRARLGRATSLTQGFAFVIGGCFVIHDHSSAEIEATGACDADARFRITLAVHGSIAGRLSRSDAPADVWNRHGVRIPLLYDAQSGQ